MLIHNTRTGMKEELITQEPSVVKAYVCGPTVYDYCHVGHARTYVNFDVLKRYLEASGYTFIHAQNFTDIDDRITKRAAETGVTPRELGDQFIGEYFRDMDALNVKRASRYTRVSEYMPQIVEVTQRLLSKGYAYKRGDAIFFDVEAAGGFGELISDPEEAVTDKIEKGVKKNPFDFVLWRGGREGEDAWDSPLGRGRPGWHTECVVMSMDALGEVLDVHWGGMDLIYPHHECESLIARSLTGKVFVKYWMHNNFVLMTGEKMSKSTGRSIQIRDVLKKYRGEVLRTLILSKNYREPIDYSDYRMKLAETTYGAIKNGAEVARRAGEGEMSRCTKEYADMFFGALDDDLETGQALAAVERLSWEINGGGSGKDFSGAYRIYDAVESVLGIRLD